MNVAQLIEFMDFSMNAKGDTMSNYGKTSSIYLIAYL